MFHIYSTFYVPVLLYLFDFGIAKADQHKSYYTFFR